MIEQDLIRRFEEQLKLFDERYTSNYDHLHQGNSKVVPDKVRNGLSLYRKQNDDTELHELNDLLEKQSGSLFGGWNERYLHLKDGKLRYYKESDSRFPQGVFNFDQFNCFVREVEDEPESFTVQMEGTDKEFKFRAPTTEIADLWRNEIRKHIEQS